MSYRQIAAMMMAAFIFLFFVYLCIYLRRQEKKRHFDMRSIANGYVAMDAAAAQSASTLSSGIFKGYAEKIQSCLDQIYETDTRPDSIIKHQIMIFVFGMCFAVIAQLLFRFAAITFGIVLTVFILTWMPYNELISQVQKKKNDFDKALPAYETNLLLGLQAGATTIKSMEMAVKTLPPGLVQIEFQQLMRDIQMTSNNIAKPYMQLAKRVDTTDCDRFGNIVISGVKNGNSMTEILTQESEYMAQQQLNRIQEAGQKAGIKATAISSGLIFRPLIIIFIAPLMSSSM